MADDETKPQVVTYQIPLVWADPEDVPFSYVNQAVFQSHQGTLLLTLGTVAPPPVLGTNEEKQKAYESIPFLPVRVQGRFSMDRAGVEDLLRIMREVLDQYDREQGL